MSPRLHVHPALWLAFAIALAAPATASARDHLPVYTYDVHRGWADRALPIGKPFILVAKSREPLRSARVLLYARPSDGCVKAVRGDTPDNAVVLDWVADSVTPSYAARVFVPALPPESAYCVGLDARAALPDAERERLGNELAQILAARLLVLAEGTRLGDPDLLKAAGEAVLDFEKKHKGLSVEEGRPLSEEYRAIKRALEATGRVGSTVRAHAAARRLEKEGGRAATAGEALVDAYLAFRGPWRAAAAVVPASLADDVKDLGCVDRVLVPTPSDTTREGALSRLGSFRRLSCEDRPEIDRARLIGLLVGVPGLVARLPSETRSELEPLARRLSERAEALRDRGMSASEVLPTVTTRQGVVDAAGELADAIIGQLSTPVDLPTQAAVPAPLVTWRVSTDLGFALITGTDDRTMARGTYLGLHFYPFGYVDTGVSVWAYPQWVRRNVSAFVGVMKGAPDRDAQPALEPLFGGTSLLLGTGLRLLDFARLNTGVAFYRVRDHNPLLDDTHVKGRWFLSLSLDVNVLQYIEKALRGDESPAP